MNISKVSYTRKFNLGDYQHEEFTVEVSFDQEEGFKDAHEALINTRKLIVANTQKYLQAKKKEKESEGES